MRRIVLVTLATFGIGATGSSQLLQNVGGQSYAIAEDLLGNYDPQFNYTYAEHQYTNTITGFGVTAFSANPAWSGSNLVGSASGNGEAASVRDSLINGASNATYTAFMSGTGDLESNITDQGPYYGVLADSYAYTNTSFYFTPTVAATMTISGEVSHPGPLGEPQVFLFDFTSGNTDFDFTATSPGNYEVNFAETLVAGDEYYLYAVTSATSAVRYDDAAENLDSPGVCSNTMYLNATLVAPAPEPATIFGLGGLVLMAHRRARFKVGQAQKKNPPSP